MGQGIVARDPPALGLGATSLLSSNHWLFADRASRTIEHAKTNLDGLGFAQPGTAVSSVNRVLQGVADSAEILVRALDRLVASQCHGLVTLPELLFVKALCTGERSDFQACVFSHRSIFKDILGARGAVAAASCICCNPSRFITMGSGMHLGAAERLWRAQVQTDVWQTNQSVENHALQTEQKLVASWIGPSAISERIDAPNSLFVWVLRRMWFCPDFAWSKSDVEEETPDQRKFHTRSSLGQAVSLLGRKRRIARRAGKLQKKRVQSFMNVHKIIKRKAASTKIG